MCSADSRYKVGQLTGTLEDWRIAGTLTFVRGLLANQVLLGRIGYGHEAGIYRKSVLGSCGRNVVVRRPRVPWQ